MILKTPKMSVSVKHGSKQTNKTKETNKANATLSRRLILKAFRAIPKDLYHAIKSFNGPEAETFCKYGGERTNCY